MDAQTFHSIFDQFPDLVLLKRGDQWLLNPVAEASCLSLADLKQLDTALPNTSLWVAQKFYQLRTVPMDDETLYFLRPDTFLASMADNVCNQLRGILSSTFGSTAQLSQSSALRSDLNAREHLANINQGLYRILRMMTQLDRCGNGRVAQCEMARVELVGCLKGLADGVQALCAEAGVELVAELPAPPLFTVGDEEQLTYAVLSLISNSISHAPQQGGCITLSLVEQDGQAVITVADNGSGFSADLLSEPLWNQPQRLLFGRGLGLGLPLAQRIASDHGGTVMASSSPADSQVVISIPIRAVDPGLFKSSDKHTEYYAGFSMKKILLSNALPRSLYFPDPNKDEK